jgi:hypothetical protein
VVKLGFGPIVDQCLDLLFLRKPGFGKDLQFRLSLRKELVVAAAMRFWQIAPLFRFIHPSALPVPSSHRHVPAAREDVPGCRNNSSQDSLLSVAHGCPRSPRGWFAVIGQSYIARNQLSEATLGIVICPIVAILELF